MAKKKSIRYICPCCYGSIDMNQIHYLCTDALCARTFLGSCNETEARRYGSAFKQDEEVDVEKSEFMGLDPRGPNAITTRNHIIRSSVNGACDVCKGKNTTKLCPRCHNVISKGAEKYGTSIYLVTGSEGVGKSHYLASLVDTLKNGYAREFGTAFSASSEKTTLKFDREYYKTVFEDGKCLPPTACYGTDSTREPLLYDMEVAGDDEPHTIAFVDTSGKDLDSSDRLAYLNISTYISGATGILFLIDPLQLPTVRAKLGLPEAEFPDIADRLDYIAEIIRDKNKIKPKNSIGIPLAVIIAKADLLIRPPVSGEDEDALFGPESALHIAREEGSVDRENLDQIDIELEEYLRRNAGERFMTSVEQFSSHAFFAVSAIGSGPDEGNLVKGVSPFRTEDPMIWFFDSSERRKWF